MTTAFFIPATYLMPKTAVLSEEKAKAGRRAHLRLAGRK